MMRITVPHTAMLFSVITALVLISPPTIAQEAPPADALTETPAEKTVPVAEQLTKIVESMRAIETRLKDRETGEATQTSQQNVLDQLDALLNMPPDPSPPSDGSAGGGRSSNPPPQSQTGNSQTRPSPGSSSKSKSTPAGDPSQMRPKPASQPGERERQNAADSEERTGPNRPASAIAAKRQRLEVDVWGHLPEKLREQLLNSYGERMLPQYEEAVRRFYDQLADPAPSRPRR